jgi:hypothetical protein
VTSRLSAKVAFCDFTGKTEVIGLSDLMTLFIFQTEAKSIICFQKHTRLKIDSVDQKLFKNQLTRVLGTSHKALERLALRETLLYTAGGERVNNICFRVQVNKTR